MPCVRKNINSVILYAWGYKLRSISIFLKRKWLESTHVKKSESVGVRWASDHNVCSSRHSAYTWVKHFIYISSMTQFLHSWFTQDIDGFKDGWDSMEWMEYIWLFLSSVVYYVKRLWYDDKIFRSNFEYSLFFNLLGTLFGIDFFT